ncbi:MAG: insulinase family protein, partial [Bacteroidota bacterium]|nr:insulinase family protein [Bacteroidota bacterium]
MIKIEKIILPNGLKVLLHKDISSSLVAFNLLYNVGSKNEDENKTGFAHLFEHLMFEGSKNIEFFDKPLQMVGGENNAFTNSDITNYYITLPKENLETAFWLESDRMLELNFSEKKLEIQKNVVIEEFNQRYL